MKALFTSLWIILAVTPLHAGDPPASSPDAAKHEHPDGVCPSALKRLGISIISSGRDRELLPQLTAATHEATAAAKSLGLATPPHLLEFVPGGQLMALATLGRHALPIWIDGMKIVHQSYGAAGVMEFVTPGCPTCISFYNASTSLNQQISIINHVAGHNDYSEHSVFAQVRNADPVRKSLELFDYIEELYQKYDHDEVSQWLQFLFSFEHLQDLSRNTFDPPEKFDPDKIPGVSSELERIVHSPERYDSDPKNPYPHRKHPRAPTPSVLQFMVKNLPVHAAEWKRKSLALFEETSRVIGFYTADKYFNEGWATIMMEILAGHSSHSTDQHMFDYMELLQGVAGWESLSNPYWLGREAIRVVRKKFDKAFEEKNKGAFFQREDIKALDDLGQRQAWAKERDRAFIDYFHKHFIDQNVDYDNLLKSLDDQWVYDKNFFLYRKALPHEIDRSLPPPVGRDGRPLPYEQKIIVSTDARRVVGEVAKKLLDWRFKTPRLFVDDMNGFGRGVFSLKHEMVLDSGWQVHGMPLQLRSAAQVLYLMARVMEKTVSLETVHIKVAEPAPQVPPEPGAGMGWWRPPVEEPSEALESRKIRIEVDQSGKVRVFVQPGSLVVDARTGEEASDGSSPAEIKPPPADTPWKIETEVLDQSLTGALQEGVNSYIEDQEISVNPDFLKAEKDYFMPQVNALMNKSLNGQFALLNHAPTAPRAIDEYKQMISQRLGAQLRRAMSGKIRSTRTKGGLRFRVMPLVPQMAFDDGMIDLIKKKVPEAPLNSVALGASYRKMRSAKSAAEHLQAEREFEGQLQILRTEQEHRSQELKPVLNTENIVQLEVETMNGKEQVGRDRTRRKKGDKVWGPGEDSGQGQGRKGNDDDPDQPTQPGDEPDVGQDDSRKDPSEIEVPLDVISAFMQEEIELPRLKPKSGLTDITDTIREGAVRKPSGERLYSRMFPSILALGRGALRQQGVDPASVSKRDMAKEGMRLLQPSHYVVKDRDIVRVPDVNAFVLIAIDLSGSMWGWPIETAKKFMFNLNVALKTKYKNIKFAYTSLDGKGKIYYDEAAFWKAWFGGGTDYAEGFKSAQEELSHYNPAQWDRYYIPIGDSGTGSEAASLDLMKNILDQIEYLAYIHVDQGYNFGTFQPEAKKILESHPFGGYAEINEAPDADLQALRTLFGKNRPKK